MKKSIVNTEGDWKVHKYGSELEIHADYGDNFPVVFPGMNGVRFYWGESQAELIALAPKMFRLLKEAQEDVLFASSGDLEERIQEVINKVEGEK